MSEHPNDGRPQPRLAHLGRRPHPRAAQPVGRPRRRPRTATARRTWSSTTTARTTGSTTASRCPSSGLSAVAGKSKEEFSPEPLPYSEMRPGCYDPVARLEDMDRAGVLASLCFPTHHRASAASSSWRRATGSSGSCACKAYNDWMIDEWCGAAPGRYIPLMLIPMWDPQLAVEEMERCAAKGATTFAFSENPAPLGLPTIHDKDRYWDPVMAGGQRPRAWSCRCTSARRRRCRRSRPTRRSWPTCAWGAIAHLGGDALVAVQRDVPALPEPQDRAVRGRDRLDPVLPRARRAGASTSSATG